jgi:hypothetical protein
MPSLEEILKKTKDKSEQIKVVRKPPSIATEDRPYSFIEKASIHPIIKTSNKVATNLQQTSNKQETKWQQSGNKLETENQNWQQSGITTSNKTCNKVATNLQQSGNKVATKTAFSELVGLQRDIIIFMYHECKNSRSRITEALTLEHISISIKHSTGSIRTTLQRLEKKECLLRVGFKNGRGGWSRYELPDSIYHDVLRSETGNKLATNSQQTSNKVASQLATQLATSASSSSSSSDLIKTTTTKLSDEWNFDISPYAQFGFTISQIKQLALLNVISAADVEQSLIEFKYDFDNNALPPIKTGKLNFLMGLLRTGHLYVSEGFKSEQEAIISEMARRAEGKRKKRLEEQFTAWEANLNELERKEIENKLPTQLMVLHRTYGFGNQEVKNWLFNYYLQYEK